MYVCVLGFWLSLGKMFAVLALHRQGGFYLWRESYFYIFAQLAQGVRLNFVGVISPISLHFNSQEMYAGTAVGRFGSPAAAPEGVQGENKCAPRLCDEEGSCSPHLFL